MPMQIAPEDPRGHVDRRTYTRAIVPGTVPDLKRRYVSIVFRPDLLTLAVWREHRHGVTSPWSVVSLTLSGVRVLSGGRLSNTEGQRYSDRYDLTTRRYDNPAPQDVIDYVRLIVDSLNAEAT